VTGRIQVAVDLLILAARAASADGRQGIVAKSVNQNSAAEIRADPNQMLVAEAAAPSDQVVAVLVAGGWRACRPRDRTIDNRVVDVRRPGWLSRTARPPAGGEELEAVRNSRNDGATRGIDVARLPCGLEVAESVEKNLSGIVDLNERTEAAHGNLENARQP
jgi:hypothetical protein